jgi:hypothetical protein
MQIAERIARLRETGSSPIQLAEFSAKQELKLLLHLVMARAVTANSIEPLLLVVCPRRNALITNTEKTSSYTVRCSCCGKLVGSCVVRAVRTSCCSGLPDLIPPYSWQLILSNFPVAKWRDLDAIYNECLGEFNATRTEG